LDNNLCVQDESSILCSAFPEEKNAKKATGSVKSDFFLAVHDLTANKREQKITELQCGF